MARARKTNPVTKAPGKKPAAKKPDAKRSAPESSTAKKPKPAAKKPNPAAGKPAVPVAAGSGWVAHPPPQTPDQRAALLRKCGVPDNLVQALARVLAYMHSPETRARADAEKAARPERVGTEAFKGAYIGARTRDGAPTGELCVVAMVDEKAPKNNVADAARLDKLAEHVGAAVDVLPVGQPRTCDWDVELPGPFDPQLGYQSQPPVWCGGSIGPTSPAATGTYGAMAASAADKYFLLSNNHVAAAVSGYVDGSPWNDQMQGRAVQHPGPADAAGVTPYAVGKVSAVVPLILFSTPDAAQLALQAGVGNTIDAAVAAANGKADAYFQLFGEDIGQTVAQKPMALTAVLERIAAQDWLPVRKVGRTTGDTYGLIKGYGRTPPIGYQITVNGAKKTVYGCFADVFHIRGGRENNRRFSNRGDSGSLIMTDPRDGKRPRAVALLFAGGGDPPNDITYAIPIERVLSALGMARFANDLG